MRKQKNIGPVHSLLLGSAIGAIVILGTATLCGTLIVNGIIPENLLNIVGIATAGIGTVAAVIVSCMQSKEKKLILSALNSALILLLLLVVHGIAYREAPYQFAVIPTVLCSGIITGTAISVKKKKRRY